jgi:cholesterol oxidase
MTGVYDVVVIGSGFGGAISAARLAQAGLSVAILERGRRWRKDEFPRTIGEVARGFWEDGKSQGLLEYRAFRKMDVIQGVGVGGGSLHYFNVSLRAPDAIFRDPRWPAAISRAALEPHYEQVQQVLEPRPLTPPPGRSALPDRTRAFLDAGRRAGRDAALVDIAVYAGPDRLHPIGRNPQRACEYCGNCMLGCHVHAKNTLDFTFLALAERSGATIFPLHAVERIEPVERGYRVRFRRSVDGAPADTTTGEVRGTRVIVAAGALGTTELLLRCRDQHGTLPRLSPALGTCFSGNGDLLVPGAIDTDALVDPGQGPPITAKIQYDAGGHLITIEDLGLPDPFFWFLEGALPPRRGRLRGLAQLALDYAAERLGFARTSRVSREIDHLVAGGRTAHFLPFLGMGNDAADGVLRLRRGELDLAWSHRRSMPMYRQMERLMIELSESAGGRYVPSPLWRWPLRKLLTAHPLGGSVLGDDPRRSVVDPCGEVWGYPGLYVADGAAIPTALSVNPSLTIGALADRVAFWILRRLEGTPRVRVERAEQLTV